MKRIKLLPENMINQIAAGEVIERPASVVKELVENSIDAGAKKVEIEISNGSRDIRVADNGYGIHKDDLILAFSRHATSKIKNQNDLWAINTLGFRGEALASIISVAKVTCITRTAEDSHGLKADCQNSEVKISETGCAVGTIMDVKDLFYNIPARLKFLKQQQTELANITETLQNIAIAHPEVAINLIHKKHSIIKTTGSSDLAIVIGEIYSKDIIKELSAVSFEDNQFDLKINGYISNPDFTRSNKKAVYIFVNGRTVKCSIISKAIDTALKDLIPSGKYPFATLNITMPAIEIDVNVHPAKREIKYTKPNLIFNFVYSAIKSALEGKQSLNGLKIVHQELQENYQIDSLTSQHLDSEVIQPQMSDHFSNNDSKVIDFSRFADLRDDEITEISIPVKNTEVYQNKIELRHENNEKINVQKPKIIGQLNNTYILIESEEGLQVIDQHIAHERYLYEKLKDNKTQNSQLLLTSEVIEPDTEQVLMLQDNTELLSKYGFELEFVPFEPISKTLSDNAIAMQAPVDTKTQVNLNFGVRLKRIPQMLADKNPEKIIFDLVESVQTNAENIENEILERIACRAAVKAGEKLSFWQMEELIINWIGTKFNKTCPHGRKISHIIPMKEIAKFFGRIQ